MSRKILYTSFNVWKKIDNKRDYFPLAISFTIPKYFEGYKYMRLVPSKELFFQTHNNGYCHEVYYKSYFKEISKYTPEFILNELLSLSNKQILLLGWEELNIYGECEFVIEWLYKCKDSAKAFALENNLFKENNDILNI